jgi:hypothetical protein
MADGDGPRREPGGEWTPIPDPTVLTTEAVTRATDIFRREIAALRELHDKDMTALRELFKARMDAMDTDRTRLREQSEDLVRRFTAYLNEFRDEVERRDQASRQVIEQRLADLDKSRTDAAASVTSALAFEREYILCQIGLARAETQRTGDVAAEKFAAVDALFASNALALAAALAAQEKAVAAQNDSNTLAISKSESSTKETIAANAAQAQTGLTSLADQLTDIKDRVVRIEATGVGVAATRTDQRLNIGMVIAALATLVAIVSFIAFALKK